MKVRSFASSLAAMSLLVAPVAVQAAPAERASAPSSEESELMGGSLLWIVLAVAAVIGAILILDGDDDPVSP